MKNALLDELLARAATVYPAEFGYDPEHDYSPAEGLPTEADFKALQRKLKCVFPPSFVAYQTTYAAHLPLGDTDADGFGWATKGAEPYRSLTDKFASARDMDAPETLIPFRDDNADLYCFDTEQADADGECPVVLWDHTSQQAVDDPAYSWPNFVAWLESGMRDPERLGEEEPEEEESAKPAAPPAAAATGNRLPGDPAVRERVVARIAALREPIPDEPVDLFPVDVRERAGYMDHAGNVVIKPQFDSAEGFYEGRAMVVVNRLNGYINPAGELVIPAEYVGAPRHFAEGRVAVCQRKDKKWLIGYLDRDGGVVTELKYLLGADFTEGLALVQMVDKRFAYIDRQGEEQLLLDPSIVCARCFCNGLAMVEVKGKKTTAGYVDLSGRVVIPAEFNGAEDFAEGRAAVRIGKGGWGFIDPSGALKIAAVYESVGRFSEGLAAVQEKGQEGLTLIDREGDTVAQTKCELIEPFSEGLAAAAVQGKSKSAGLVTGYINPAGEMVIAPQWMEGGPFRHGLAQVLTNSMKSAYIDRSGQPVWREK